MTTTSGPKLSYTIGSTDFAPRSDSSAEAPLLCTVEETAHLLNISRTAVYSQLRSGALRSVKVGGRRLIPRQAISNFVNDLLL